MKKVLGYLFYLLGSILVLGLLFGGLPTLFKSLLTRGGSYITGQILGFVMVSVGIYIFFKYARKWTKKQPKLEVENIEKI